MSPPTEPRRAIRKTFVGKPGKQNAPNIKSAQTADGASHGAVDSL
jgi:hypothetical protein